MKKKEYPIGLAVLFAALFATAAPAGAYEIVPLLFLQAVESGTDGLLRTSGAIPAGAFGAGPAPGTSITLTVFAETVPSVAEPSANEASAAEATGEGTPAEKAVGEAGKIPRKLIESRDALGRPVFFVLCWEGSVLQAKARWKDGRVAALELEDGNGESLKIDYAYAGGGGEAVVRGDRPLTFSFSALPSELGSGVVVERVLDENGTRIDFFEHRVADGLLRTSFSVAEGGSLAETMRLDYDSASGLCSVRTPRGTLTRASSPSRMAFAATGSFGEYESTVVLDERGLPVYETVESNGSAVEYEHAYSMDGDFWTERETTRYGVFGGRRFAGARIRSAARSVAR